MKTVIYYYTGTGNSLWTARLLAAELDDAEIWPMVRVTKDGVAPEADEKCNACAVCAKVCPVGNIVMEAKRPTWQHHCEQCLACLQWCPREAIQFGKKTPAYERYHHPEVRLKDMMLTSSTPDPL